MLFRVLPLWEETPPGGAPGIVSTLLCLSRSRGMNPALDNYFLFWFLTFSGLFFSFYLVFFILLSSARPSCLSSSNLFTSTYISSSNLSLYIQLLPTSRSLPGKTTWYQSLINRESLMILHQICNPIVCSSTLNLSFTSLSTYSSIKSGRASVGLVL